MSFPHAWRYVSSVDKISIDSLLDEGISCVLIDRDNTCVPRDADTAPEEIVAWLDEVRSRGIKTCVVSNNFHSKQVEESARELGCEVVHHAMKPAPFAVWKAMRLMGATADETVLIGDQLFTDAAAGNFAGVRTILVKPLSEKDLWYTLIFRKVERLVYGERSYE